MARVRRPRRVRDPGRRAPQMALNIDLAPTLHDVVRDPGQQRNLIGTPEGDARVAELRALLEALRRGERFDA